MRFFASWWERIPVREVAPVVVAMVAAVAGFGVTSHFVQRILGSVWG
jgi:hypothetical protein